MPDLPEYQDLIDDLRVVEKKLQEIKDNLGLTSIREERSLRTAMSLIDVIKDILEDWK